MAPASAPLRAGRLAGWNWELQAGRTVAADAYPLDVENPGAAFRETCQVSIFHVWRWRAPPEKEELQLRFSPGKSRVRADPELGVRMTPLAREPKSAPGRRGPE